MICGATGLFKVNPLVNEVEESTEDFATDEAKLDAYDDAAVRDAGAGDNTSFCFPAIKRCCCSSTFKIATLDSSRCCPLPADTIAL